MLEDNNFVRCLMIDFTKAFDNVDHDVLVSKLVGYNVSPPIIDWTDGSQVVLLQL